MSETHPFADMLKQMRKKGSGGFDSLSVTQRWQWHADVYAFRHVMLDVRADVHVSPADPKGEWYGPGMVECCVAYYRRKYIEPKQRAEQAKGDIALREGRDLVTKWAQSQGFVSVDDYCERHGNDELAAHRDYLNSPEFKAASTRNGTTGCG